MSILDKVKLASFFGLGDYEEEEAYERPVAAREPERQHQQQERREQRVASGGGGGQEYSYSEQPRVNVSSEEVFRKPSSNVVNLHNNSSNSQKVASNDFMKENHASSVHKIQIVQPRVYSEANDIARAILKNEVVLVNFSVIDESQARRIVDFLTGTVMAIQGNIERVGNEIFLCTPPEMEIESALASARSVLGDSFVEF